MGAAGSLLEPMHYECDACSTMYIPDEPRDPRCPRCGNNGHHQHGLTNTNHTADTIAEEIYDHYRHHHRHHLQQVRQLPPRLLEQQVRHDNPVRRSETRDFGANILSHGINPQLLLFLNSEAFRQGNHRGARREGRGGGGGGGEGGVGAISSSFLSSPFGEGVGTFDAMQLRAALQNSLAESNEMKTNPASIEAVRCLHRHTVQRSDKKSMAHATTDDDAERTKTDVCVICSEVPRVGEVITTMPCKHSFHDQCLRTWLKQVSLIFRQFSFFHSHASLLARITLGAVLLLLSTCIHPPSPLPIQSLSLSPTLSRALPPSLPLPPSLVLSPPLLISISLLCLYLYLKCQFGRGIWGFLAKHMSYLPIRH